ncbi:MAG: rRNA maturation RNase YbeY [Xanthomonadales bacterium]|nr:rRNA maturation RNase YbeY [Xanthomonadales bacterium]
MAIELDLQIASSFEPLPTRKEFLRWLGPGLLGRASAELTIRLVDFEESRRLNVRYRGMDKPTNVLSFPADLPDEVDLPLLGDIVICAPLVAREASDVPIPIENHWAHLTIHGLLHLLGHDHQETREAEKMEALEASLLHQLGIADPYIGE